LVLVMALPLKLKRIGREDFAVMAGNRVAGRIMVKPMASGAVWFWNVTRPHLPAQLQPSNGEANTLEAAKLAFKAK
jgi:streptogramin lyase